LEDSEFIVVLQTGFGSGFLPLGSGLVSDSKKLDSENLCAVIAGQSLEMLFIGKLNITKIKQVNQNTNEKANPQK